MAMLEIIAEAALRRDSLLLRRLVMEFTKAYPKLAMVPRPAIQDQQILSMAAALVELFAQRTNQPAPDWTHEIGAVPQPAFLLEAATKMKRLRALCESESPEPLRKRGFYAPPDFLTFA